MLNKIRKVPIRQCKVTPMSYKDFKSIQKKEGERTTTQVLYVDVLHSDVDKTMIDNSVVNLDSVLDSGLFLKGSVEHELTDPVTVSESSAAGVETIINNSNFDKEL